VNRPALVDQIAHHVVDRAQVLIALSEAISARVCVCPGRARAHPPNLTAVERFS
jgi:hypothetical protein